MESHFDITLCVRHIIPVLTNVPRSKECGLERIGTVFRIRREQGRRGVAVTLFPSAPVALKPFFAAIDTGEVDDRRTITLD
jgi:hypothetical protein